MSNGKLFGGLLARVARNARAFVSSRRGNVAMIYALALIPLAGAAGAGLDYARAVVVRANMEEAIDSAALAIVSTTGLTNAQMTTLAQQYFNANYKTDASYGTPGPVAVTPGTQNLTISVTDNMPTTLVSVIGINTMPVQASTVVVWGQLKLRVSLVLDNTGSMCEPDSNPCPGDNNPNIKINALKTATTSLLALLKGAAVNAGDVKVAIVPFTVAVNVGAANYAASWMTWTDFDAVKPSTPSSNVGPNSNCPWTDGSQGYHCQASPSDTTTVSKVPNSGTYKGYICPSSTIYSGCFNSTGASSPYTHTWIPYHPEWSGCVMDRTQNYDTQNDLPTSSTTDFPAAPPTGQLSTNSSWNLTCPTQLIGQTDVLDSTGWTNLNNTVTNMVAGGGTNQTIGLAWGWMMMTPGAPILNPGALPVNTQQVIIILSDGLNTMDRWYGNGSSQSTSVDNRMSTLCTNAKAAGITIYAVFVDLNGTQGNSTVLQNCATDSSKYFDLTAASQIVSTFNQIGQQITNLRVMQ